MPIDDALKKIIGKTVPNSAAEFYKKIEGIVVFPGSLDELNDRMRRKLNGQEYAWMEMEGDNQYLTGSLLPTKKEMEYKLSVQFAALTALKGSDALKELGRIGKFDEEESDEEEFDEEEITQAKQTILNLFGIIYENPTLIDFDLRIQAKKMDADGLVYVRLAEAKEDIYMAVPVKKIVDMI